LANIKRSLSRKDFLKRSSLGILGAGLIAGSPATMFTGSHKPARGLTESELGKTGIKLTKLGVGAPRIQEASVLRYALDQGIRFIDTGRFYAEGKNELMIGDVIKGKRKEFAIQSKVRIKPDIAREKLQSESTSSFIRKIFFKSLEESLEALQTDYIDILLFHDGSTSQWLYHEAVLESFSRAKEEGKILACGFSAHTNQVDLVRNHNRDPFYDVMMLAFNPHGGYLKPGVRDYSWDQQALITELTKAADVGTGIIAMKTCLGGPYSPDETTEASFPLAVKWILDQPYIHGSAVAMANFKQLDDHLSMMEQ
jgi:predicted aldo/keto reductase-like oxidoreductase